MTTTPSVPSDVRYVLTEAGRNALKMAVECECQMRLKGMLLECVECGTVYGTIKEGLNSRFRRNGRGLR